MLIRTRHSLCMLILSTVVATPAFAQVPPEEHAKHHPGQSASDKSGAEGDIGDMMGDEKDETNGGEMMGGAMGGTMKGMMDRLGAPTPKELYPRLIEFPDLPPEQRAMMQQEAHGRMLQGTRLLSEGLEQLSDSASGDDYAALQAATATLREGLAQSESGLAAHLALAEGNAPRNVALQWFTRELNLLSPSSAEQRFHLFGMSVFHTAILAVLVVFTVAMTSMYYFKMRQAFKLLDKLATADERDTSSFLAEPPASCSSIISPGPPKQVAPQSSPPGGAADCCADSAVE